MMMAVYSLILVASALATAYFGARALARMAPHAGLPPHHAQLAVCIAFIGFLIVTGMPAGIMIAAIAACACGIAGGFDAPGRARWLWLGAVALLAMLGLWDSPGEWPRPVPEAAMLAAAFLLVPALLVWAQRNPAPLLPFALATTAAAVPLIAAPLLHRAAHGSLALDQALLLAGLLGGVRALPPAMTAHPLLRAPVTVLIAYGALQAMHYGVWPSGVLALLLYAGGLRFAAGRGAEHLA